MTKALKIVFLLIGCLLLGWAVSTVDLVAVANLLLKLGYGFIIILIIYGSVTWVDTIAWKNNFRKDELVTSGTASKADYWYSGYDRGHLAPSADFRWSKTALSESYFYSNMAPQLPELNREKWAELENAIREYVIENKIQVYVVTGGILNDSLPRMQNKGRENEVSIPGLS